jgi:hypothetical protein
MISWDGDHHPQAEDLTSATVTIPEELAPGCSMRTSEAAPPAHLRATGAQLDATQA